MKLGRLVSFVLVLMLCLGTILPAVADDVAVNETGYPIVNEPITVKFVCSTTAFTGEPEQLKMMNVLEEITGIHIEWIKLEDAQVDVFLASDEEFDLMYEFGNASRVQNYGVIGGMFADWNDYLYLMPNYSAWLEEIPLMRKVVTETNGAMYALPMYNKGATSVTTRFMVRLDVLEACGLEMPSTVEDFYDCCKVALESGITQGFAPLLPTSLGNFNTRIEPFFFACFGPSVDVDFTSVDKETVTYSRVSDQYKEYLKYMNRLYSEGLLEQEYLTIDKATSSARVKDGLCLFNDDMQNVEGSDFASGVIEIDQVWPLTSDFNDVRHTRAFNFASFGGGMMSAKTKYPEAIARLVDCWYAKEEIVEGCGIISESFINGIYGEDFWYETEENGDYTLVVNIPDWSELTVQADYLAKYVKPKHSFGAKISLGIGGTENILARQRAYIRNNHPYQEEYFPQKDMKFTVEEQEVINNVFTDINSYVIEARGKFIAGIDDIDATWESYVNTVYEMGLEDVIEVYQAAYDRWNQ